MLHASLTSHHPRESVDHCPLFVGIDQQERNLYLGSFDSNTYIVAEGTTSAHFADYYGMLQEEKRRQRLVLRYDRPFAAQWLPAITVAAAHVRWRKLTPKGKLQLERGRTTKGPWTSHVITRRSSEYMEVADSWRIESGKKR